MSLWSRVPPRAAFLTGKCSTKLVRELLLLVRPETPAIARGAHAPNRSLGTLHLPSIPFERPNANDSRSMRQVPPYCELPDRHMSLVHEAASPRLFPGQGSRRSAPANTP